MHINAASCLRPIAEKENNNLRGHSIAIPGLELNPHHPNPKQRLQFLLNNDKNNTISQYTNPRNDPTEDYPAADPKQLCSVRRSFKPRIPAILHCQRH